MHGRSLRGANSTTLCVEEAKRASTSTPLRIETTGSVPSRQGLGPRDEGVLLPPAKSGTARRQKSHLRKAVSYEEHASGIQTLWQEKEARTRYILESQTHDDLFLTHNSALLVARSMRTEAYFLETHDGVDQVGNDATTLLAVNARTANQNVYFINNMFL